jgi:carboxypeptidase C (cathepsin A)
MLFRRLSSFACAVAVVVTATLGVRTAPAGAADPPAPAIPAQIPAAVTHHVARIGGREIRYTATAGTILLTNDKNAPTASVFYVAYVADGLGPHEKRPITFSYNGGPGGSSALVHMGAFGPRMVVTTNASATHPPPYDIVDNDDSLLPSTDLVFVDAVGTGFSTLVGSGTAKDYYGVNEDGKAFTQFIRRYITANDRWNSPKYLAGESYGTTRSCVVGKMMQDAGIAPSGIVLMSSVLDFSTLEPQSGDDEPYWMFLPTESAVAAYQRKTTNPADSQAFLQTVRAYAQGPYAQALAKGAALPPAERDAVAQQLHAYLGLPVAYLVKSDLRVPPGRFMKQLLGDENETIGRYDGRFTAFDVDPAGSDADTDPSSDAVDGAFTAAFNRYIREELHYRTDANYEFLSYAVNRAWNWKQGANGSPAATNVSDDLRDAMTANPYLRVFSANGIYDLATPFFATEYSLGHLGLAPQLQGNIRFGYYPSGHMVYLNPVAHASLAHDLNGFIR